MSKISQPARSYNVPLQAKLCLVTLRFVVLNVSSASVIFIGCPAALCLSIHWPRERGRIFAFEVSTWTRRPIEPVVTHISVQTKTVLEPYAPFTTSNTSEGFRSNLLQLSSFSDDNV